MDAEHAQATPSQIALLANILALSTRNMTAISAMLAQLAALLAKSRDLHLQNAAQGMLDQITTLGADLDMQWDLIQSLERFCPLLARTPPARTALVTEITLTDLPKPQR
ncbi:hypothetical protein [Pseudomonas indica]|uniref:Uncharacterized protein n=1 Tax=Pseudomonas indica TaxID=137658 RepID=A0A1G9KFK1_9PSED|nr:hypothetical protein [Pseudomonas indica]MBU3055248.1 hypothetical protein [Pseudomonas indica]PAU61513.1 hypothetical protein BZL42_07990 [Pseudomonas indica]SDL48284.1 hypothetical protein SAMN05216186_12229 [Pseudomonas indica]